MRWERNGRGVDRVIRAGVGCMYYAARGHLQTWSKMHLFSCLSYSIIFPGGADLALHTMRSTLSNPISRVLCKLDMDSASRSYSLSALMTGKSRGRQRDRGLAGSEYENVLLELGCAVDHTYCFSNGRPSRPPELLPQHPPG